ATVQIPALAEATGLSEETLEAIVKETRKASFLVFSEEKPSTY
ncbi:MAG: potassium-transporting ATPase subunit C, partial [Dehalobacterium sp.]